MTSTELRAPSLSATSAGTAGSTGPLERDATSIAASRIIVVSILALLPILFVWVFWQAQVAFFLLFAGVLLAAIIDACARGLSRFLPFGRLALVGGVVAIFVLAVIGVVGFGGAMLVENFGGLVALVASSADEVAAISGMLSGEEGEEASSAIGVLRQAASLLPGSGEGTFSLLQSTFGYLANALIIFFIGVFLAIEPDLYRRGLVRLFPPSTRETVGSALSETGETLRAWLIGKLASMTMIFLFTWLGLWLVGFPFSFAIGLLAGALAFIPNIGPILTYIPIALVGFSLGSTTTLLYGLGIYLAAQTIESYIFTPIIQKRMVSLPPALIFFSQILGGILFGLWGVALATPLAAVAKTLIETLYIQKGLEENVEEVDPHIENGSSA